MKSKTKKIEAQIEELKAKLTEQKRREADALEAEMLRVVRKAGCQREAIGFAQRLIAQKQTERSGS
jgi:hypothetical protein